MTDGTARGGEPLVGPDRTKRRGSGGIALVIIMLLIVGLVAGLWWYSTTPRFALTRLAQSAQGGDWEGVRRYMEVDAVADDIVDSAIEQALADRESQIGQLGLLGEGLAAGIAEAMKPQLAEEVRAQMREQVEAQEGSARTWFGAIVVGADPESLDVQNGEARAVVVLPYRGQRVRLDLGMQRADGRWRVVTLNNAAELVQQYGPDS